jgi:drug/metabolite transporter (DMT)-like permease
MILIIILYALFALSVFISKVIFSYSTPIFYIGARMSIAGMILLAYQYIAAREHFKFKKEHLWQYVQVVFFGIYFTYIIRFWGLTELPVSKAMFMFNLAPFMSALFSYFFFNEAMSRKKWLGLMIGFIGFIPIVVSKVGQENLSQLFFISWPEVAVLISVICHSYNWIVIRKLVRDHSQSPAMINGLTMFIGGVGALITSPFFEGFQPVNNYLEFGKLLVCVILISNLICHNLYAYLLKTYTATFLSFAGFMSPIFAALYGWLWLNEKITWHFYVSSVVVFIGLVLFYQDELKSMKREVPEIIE